MEQEPKNTQEHIPTFKEDLESLIGKKVESITLEEDGIIINFEGGKELRAWDLSNVGLDQK